MPNIRKWFPADPRDQNPRFIYFLVDPRTNGVRYVGMAVNPIARLKAHYSSPIGSAMKTWMAHLRELRLKPLLRVVETCRNLDAARRREMIWVQHWLERIGHELLNSKGVGTFIPYDVLRQRAVYLTNLIEREKERREEVANWPRLYGPDRGKQYTHAGLTMTATKWAKHLGISRQRVHQRLKKMSVAEALSRPNQTA